MERDYEQLVEDMNKETDSRVSELQNQLEVTHPVLLRVMYETEAVVTCYYV